MKGKDESQKVADLEGEVALRDKRIVDLEADHARLLKEREDMKNELLKA